MKWVEITNPIHGGPGWELGTCLWSPVRNRGGTKSWEIMNSPKPGDQVYHLVKERKGLGYYLRGRSIVASPANVIRAEPLNPTDWKGMAPYYRVDLVGYEPIPMPLNIDETIQRNTDVFIKSLRERKKGQFFELKKNGKIQISLKYLAYIDGEVEVLFNSFFKIRQISSPQSFESFIPEKMAPAYPDYSPPGEVSTTITRKIRDTKISKEVKIKANNCCAICNYTIPLKGGGNYSEAHHIKPLGGGHLGPDIESNLIVLCPTHHAEFDYGVIAIDPGSKTVIHLDPENIFHKKEIFIEPTAEQISFLTYHFTKIFMANRGN